MQTFRTHVVNTAKWHKQEQGSRGVEMKNKHNWAIASESQQYYVLVWQGCLEVLESSESRLSQRLPIRL